MKLTVKEHLAAPGSSTDVLAHASRLLLLDRQLKTLLPPVLAGNCHVANLKAGKLIIHADSGVVAARLRQMTARLAQQLSLSCLQCSEVEVKVQPQSRLEATPPPVTSKALSSNAAESLRQVASGMQADTPLRRALEHLLAQTAQKAQAAAVIPAAKDASG